MKLEEFKARLNKLVDNFEEHVRTLEDMEGFDGDKFDWFDQFMAYIELYGIDDRSDFRG